MLHYHCSFVLCVSNYVPSYRDESSLDLVQSFHAAVLTALSFTALVNIGLVFISRSIRYHIITQVKDCEHDL